MKKTVHSLAGAALILLSAMHADAQPLAAKPKKIVSNDLLAVKSPSISLRQSSSKLTRVTGATVSNGLVVIDAVSSEADGSKLLQKLTALGLKNGSYYQRVVSGQFPVNKIDQLEGMEGAREVKVAYTPVKSVGSVTSQAYQAMKADVAKASYGVTGVGSRIGIISDSYDAFGGAAAGVASGDLPADTKVFQDYPYGSDEGRAMAELVYDVAPGAKLSFATAYYGQAGFANNIMALANRGCNIIVDDIIYFAEPYFQDGIIAQAVNHVTGQNVSYFSSAGNNANSSYEAKWKNSGKTIPGWGVPHDFGGGDTRQKFTFSPYGTMTLGLQWDDPFYSVSRGEGAKTDIDLLIYLEGEEEPIFYSIDNNLGGDPFEFISLYSSSPDPISVEIAIVKYAGPDPKYLKWIHFGNGDIPTAIEHDTKSSTVVGHANALGAIAVGAAPYYQTPVFAPGTKPVAEYFTSLGGTPVFITEKGVNTGFAEWKRRLKPQITAPDGTNTTFFGFDIEGDGFYNFFGTSAAAPHAAAVAALMQEGNKKKMSPLIIASVMALSAIDMDNNYTPGFDKGFDALTGFGLIQADKCVQLTRFGANTLEPAAAPPLISSADAAPKVQLDAYPNPSKGVITVSAVGGKSSGPTQITITNTLGQQVVSFTAAQGMMQKQINLAKYGKGLYIIKLTADGETVTKKLVVN